MKKSLALILAMLLASSLALTGCIRGNASSTAAPGSTATSAASEAAAPVAEGATTLSLWTFQQQHEVFYRAMAEEWNAANPDKQIALDILVQEDKDLNNNLAISFQSGTGAPDIVDIEINKYQNYLKGEPQLVPLNDIVEPVLDDIVQARVNVYAKDGNYYGICFHVGAEVIYYNTELTEAAGVNIDELTTWDKYHEAGKKVLEATGVPMTTIETSDSWSIWPMMSQQDSDFFDANGDVSVDNEKNVKVMTYLQSMVQDGTAILSPGGYHHTEEYYGFMNGGGAASIWMPMWYMGRFTDYMPDLKGKMAIRPMPAWDEGGYRSATMGGTGTSITVQSKNIDLAKEFLAFAKLSPEGNLKIWEILGFDPINTTVWDRPEMKEPNAFTDYFGENLFDTLIEVQDEFYDVHLTEKSPMMENLMETDGLIRIFQDMEDPAAVLKDIGDQVRNS